jgi:hypothetical protein
MSGVGEQVSIDITSGMGRQNIELGSGAVFVDFAL